MCGVLKRKRRARESLKFLFFSGSEWFFFSPFILLVRGICTCVRW